MPKVKMLRDSYYGARQNDLGKFILLRNSPSPLNPCVVVPITEYVANKETSDVMPTQQIDTRTIPIVDTQLFRRPEHRLTQREIGIVWTEMEWNMSGHIISVGAYYKDGSDELKFYSLVKQSTAGRTSVHNITKAMLKQAPSTLVVFKEYLSFLTVLNCKKVVLAGHFATGADFPKLMRTIHNLGLKIELDVELADTRYSLAKAVKGQGNTSLKLSDLYARVSNDSYDAHNSLADSIALRTVFIGLVGNGSSSGIYGRLLNDIPRKSIIKYYRMIMGCSEALPVQTYMQSVPKRRKRQNVTRRKLIRHTSSDDEDSTQRVEDGIMVTRGVKFLFSVR